MGWLVLPARGVAGPSSEVLAHKQRQLQGLRQLLDGSARAPNQESAPRWGTMMLRLARLELEVAILQVGRAGRSEPDLEPPVVTCRRLLQQQPAFPGADEVRLLLARLEHRRGRTQAALEVLGDLLRLHPGSALRCEARLLIGACHLDARLRGRAEQVFTQLAESSCPATFRRQAQYQLAWALLADKRSRQAAYQLRQLCQDPGSDRGMRDRALRDLVLAWSMERPDADAVRFLFDRAADHKQASRLLLQLARQLVDTGKVQPLMTLTAGCLSRGGVCPSALMARLRVLRLRALARGGSVKQLERELSFAAGGLDAPLRREVAAAILELALRTSKEQPCGDAARCARSVRAPGESARLARHLLERLIRAYGGTPAAREAPLHLGQLLLRNKEPGAAAVQLEAATRQAPAALRVRAAHLLVHCREQLLDAAGPGALTRFVEAARSFIRRFPATAEAPGVQLALGSRLVLVAGREGEAAGVLRGYVDHNPPLPRRQEAIDLLFAALARAAKQEELHRRVALELAGCGPPVASSPGNERCGRLRRLGAQAAREQCRLLTAKGRWSEAQLWAVRALEIDPLATGEARRRTQLVAASLAARAGKPEEGLSLLRRILAQQVDPAHRREVLTELARHQESLGRLTAAARSHMELADATTDVDGRMGQLEQAALVAALGGDAAFAKAVVRKLRRALSEQGVPSRLVGPMQLRIGRLLERAAGRRAAHRHYLQQAHALWRYDGQAAASCLVRAAELSATSRRSRQLFEQARTQAGRRLRRRGKLVLSAVKARLGLARLAREARGLPDSVGRARKTVTAGGVERRLLALQEHQQALLPLVSLEHPRWAAAAALELARLTAATVKVLRRAPLPAGLSEAERQRYVQAVAERAAGLSKVHDGLIRRLAARAAAPGGLNRFTLAAAREARGLPWSAGLARTTRTAREARGLPDSAGRARTGDALPAHPAGAPVVALLRAQKSHAARRVATRAMEVHGPLPDLLCERAIAQLALDHVSEGVADLERALGLAPDNRCARQHLDALLAEVHR